MKDGLRKNDHQPESWMSACGRNEVMNRPNVGMVHSTAITTANNDAQRELSALPASAAAADLRETFFGVTGAGTGIVSALITRPPFASDERCRSRWG